MKLDRKVKLLLVLVISIALTSSIYLYINSSKQYEEIPYKLFLTHVEKGLVDEIELSDRAKITGKLKNGESFITDNPRTEDFKEFLLLYNINVKEVDKSGVLGQGISFILLLAGIGVVAYLVNSNNSKQAEKEMTNMSKMDTESPLSNRITFNDVAGNEEAKESLKELIDFIKTQINIINMVQDYLEGYYYMDLLELVKLY